MNGGPVEPKFDRCAIQEHEPELGYEHPMHACFEPIYAFNIHTALSHMNLIRTACVFLLTGVFSAYLCSAQVVQKIDTPRGQSVEMLLDFPSGAEPFPVLLLAPGQGYHARLPVLENLAQSLKAQGVAVVRFNWAYFSKDPKSGEPSEGFTKEVEDFRAVLKALRQVKSLDLGRLALGGKSLGTLVAWQVFRDEPTAVASVLLTPVCISQSEDKATEAMFENYVGLRDNTRPLLLLSGDADSICPSKFLYNAASRIADRTRVVVIGGDHSFRAKDGDDAKQQSEVNLDLAVRITTDFVVSKLRKP